ncbi:Tetratricopeptide repeat protein 29, partial [Phlyctochytrium bullatum]
ASRASVRQSICLDLLKDGFVKSYCDFFSMVFQNEEETFSNDELQALQKLLSASELSQRSTDARPIYEAKKNIAQFFRKLNRSDLAVKYFKEALDSAKMLIGNKEIEVEASQNLGQVLEHYERPTEALDYYEISRKLARDANNVEAEVKNSKRIVGVRVKIAEQLEAQHDCHGAIAHYIQCLTIVQESNFDESLAYDLKFRLGKVYRQVGEIEKATEHLEDYLHRCQAEGDTAKEGPAQAALASCYETSGDLDKAISHLTQFVVMTQDEPSKRSALAHACNQLGILYNKIGQYEEAVKHFDKHFELVRSLSKTEGEKDGSSGGPDAAKPHEASAKGKDGSL